MVDNGRETGGSRRAGAGSGVFPAGYVDGGAPQERDPGDDDLGPVAAAPGDSADGGAAAGASAGDGPHPLAGPPEADDGGRGGVVGAGELYDGGDEPTGAQEAVPGEGPAEGATALHGGGRRGGGLSESDQRPAAGDRHPGRGAVGGGDPGAGGDPAAGSDPGLDEAAYEQGNPYAYERGHVYHRYADEQVAGGPVFADGPVYDDARYADDPRYAAADPADGEARDADDPRDAGDPRYADDPRDADDPRYAADPRDADDDRYGDEPEYAGAGRGRRYRYVDDGYWDDGESRVARLHLRKWWRRPILVSFLAVVLIVILLAGGTILWASRQIDPGGRRGPDVLVTIASGATPAEIGTDLARAGVIHNARLFRYYLKIENDGALQSGTFRFAKNDSYDEAIATLQAAPAILNDKLVIPEGFTLQQIAARVAALPGMHLSAKKFLALSATGSVRSPFEPTGVNDLEGLVYAATYSFERTDSESTILEEMVGDFTQQMQALGLVAGAKRLHMTPYQLVTVASIVQGEAKFSNQFPDVASVIYNRLAAGVKLGADSTLVYALRAANPNVSIAKVNFETPSPYNTRLNAGLPPTPINSPSLAALTAAIKPPTTNLQYFVEINPDGTLGFASTPTGFQQLVTTCQAHKLC